MLTCREIYYRYTIITAEEWAKLMQFYDVDYPIVIKKVVNSDFQTEPGKYKSHARQKEFHSKFKRNIWKLVMCLYS